MPALGLVSSKSIPGAEGSVTQALNWRNKFKSAHFQSHLRSLDILETAKACVIQQEIKELRDDDEE